MDNKELKKIVDRYENIRSLKVSKCKDFIDGKRPYMIFQRSAGRLFGDIRSPEECFKANMENLEIALDIPSDDLPVMEPWFGTGVYANMYGCPYLWRDGEAPAVHYKYHSIDEIRHVIKPKWENSEIAQLVIETIRYMKQRTGNALPITWTDTQSASDTASLVLDASEFFIGCLTEPELMMSFLNDINDLTIEFSKVQAELIGDALLMPGHIMLSNTGLRGMSISDDNLAVASPAVNADFNLILDEKIGKAMGGVAIHSCGTWAHTMPMLREKVPSCVAIDCKIDNSWDPNPNEPEKVRDALAGSGIHVQVRVSGKTDEMVESVKRMLHPDLKLIVQPGFIDKETAVRNYEVLEALLTEYYSNNK